MGNNHGNQNHPESDHEVEQSVNSQNNQKKRSPSPENWKLKETENGLSEFFDPPEKRPESSTNFNGEICYYGKVIPREPFDPKDIPPQKLNRNFRREFWEELVERERRLANAPNRYWRFVGGGLRRGFIPRQQRGNMERGNPAQPPNRKWMNGVGLTENDPPFFSNLPESR